MLAGCTSSADAPEALQEEQSQTMDAPQLSRSVTSTDAAIAAFSKDGTRKYLWKLEKNGEEWEWASGTQATLSGWDTLVCVVPYLSGLSTSTSYTPSADATLQWGKMARDEQHEDGRFYFKHVSHRLAQVFVEVDRYYSGDGLRMYLATRGDFNALSGGFADLYESSKTIRPEKTDSGTYVYTFSIVPQTFAKGERMFRYKDVHSTYYDYYYYEAEEDLTVPANHRLNIRLKWREDWERGGRYYTTVSVTGVSLNKTELVLDPEQTETLVATVSPSDATDKSVTWTSSDPKVATVDSTGKVTAIKAGETIVTVQTTNGQTATCTVTVRAEISGSLENGNSMEGKNPSVSW